MQLSMLCPRGGGPRDRVGTLNVRAHPTWGILANFEHKCWPPGSGSLNNVRTRKATTVLNAGSLRMSAPPIFFHVIAYSCNSVVFFVMLG